MKPFDQGWRDYLHGLPPRAIYKKTLPSVQYERGRHLAALWKFYVEKCGRTIHSRGGVASNTQFAHTWTFEQAQSFMPQEMLEVIYAEERFCTMKCELP